MDLRANFTLLSSVLRLHLVDNNFSQDIFFLAGPCVLVHMPFGVPVLVLQRPSPDFKEPHRHPRAHFREFHTLVTRSDEDMVAVGRNSVDKEIQREGNNDQIR